MTDFLKTILDFAWLSPKRFCLLFINLLTLYSSLFGLKDCKNLKPWVVPAHSILLVVKIYFGCCIPLIGRHSLLPSFCQTPCEAGKQVGMSKMLSLAAGS